METQWRERTFQRKKKRSTSLSVDNREEVYRFSILYNEDSPSSRLLSGFLKVKEVHDWEFMVGANPLWLETFIERSQINWIISSFHFSCDLTFSRISGENGRNGSSSSIGNRRTSLKREEEVERWEFCWKKNLSIWSWKRGGEIDLNLSNLSLLPSVVQRVVSVENGPSNCTQSVW